MSERAEAGHVILLHGASSSGKSTLAAAVQDIHPLPLWHWSIDKIRAAGVLPDPRVARGAFSWRDLRAPFFEGFHRSIEAFASAGNSLLVEHIFEDPGMRDDVLGRLSNLDLFVVGLHTPLAVLKEREATRKDRPAGSAAADFARVHHGCAI